MHFYWVISLLLFLTPHLAADEGTEVVKQKQKAPLVHSEMMLFLTDGSKVRGIARSNKFHEKAQDFTFIECEPTDPIAGMRLWFVEGTNSYVFYPNHVIKRREIMRGLTEAEFRVLAKKVEEVAKKKAEDLAQKKAQEELFEDHTLSKQEIEEELKKKQSEREQEIQALLSKFPPEEGWGKEKLEQIRQNKINDIYPNELEAEFEKSYGEWEKAYDIWVARKLEELKKTKEALESSQDKANEQDEKPEEKDKKE